PLVSLPPFSAPPGATDPDSPRMLAAAPLGTPDLRKNSRAFRADDESDPLAKFTLPQRDDDGTPKEPDAVYWRIRARRGVPCFPGSYDDRAARTADIRSPERGGSGHHPRRISVFVQPPFGFFEPGLKRVTLPDPAALPIIAGEATEILPED